MVDGTMTFTVDNGRGPITAVFKPTDKFNFCDGKWHEIHAVKVPKIFFITYVHTNKQPYIYYVIQLIHLFHCLSYDIYYE